MTETPPESGSTDAGDGDWNRQTSTVDWEGWIAEANEADARRAAAEAQRAADQAAAEATLPPDQFATPQYQGQQYPAPQHQYPAQQYPAPQYPEPQYPEPQYPEPQYPEPQYPEPQYPGQQFAPGQPLAHQFPAGQPNYPPPTGYPPAGGYLPSGYPQPGAQFQPFPAPSKAPLDVVSVLALIFGFLPTVLIGLVLGIIGIARTAHPARRGRGLAVTGLVLSLLWAAIFIVIPVLAKHGDSRSAAAGGAVTRATTMSPTELRTGDCYTDTVLTNRQAPASTMVGTVEVVPCSQPHNAVIYAMTTLPAGAWTSMSDKLTIANRQCQPLAIKYFNGVVVNPNLQLGAFAPSQAEWEIGFHRASCIVVDPDKSFVGDIRQDR